VFRDDFTIVITARRKKKKRGEETVGREKLTHLKRAPIIKMKALKLTRRLPSWGEAGEANQKKKRKEKETQSEGKPRCRGKKALR